MKKILILIISIFLLISCWQEEKIEGPKIPLLWDMLETCSSECWDNSQKYCLEEKTFLNNSNHYLYT